MKRSRAIALGLIVVASVALASVLDALGELSGVQQFESFTLDYRQTTTAESFLEGIGARESEIVLVLFDEFSVMDSVSGWDWISPYPRDHLAQMIDALAAAGARTIGLDVYLDRLWPRLGGDEQLRDAIERSGNVVLVTPVEETDSGPVSVPPHRYFASVAAGVGTAELPAAFETFRDGTLAARSGGGLAPSFALALYAHQRGLDADSILSDAVERERIALPGLPENVGRFDRDWLAETGSTGRNIVPFRIRYVGPPSSADAEDQAGTFTAVTSFSLPMMTAFTPDRFADKIVLLGTGFHAQDRFRTPFEGYVPPADESLPDPEPYGWMYGVEVHAHALQNMLDGEYVRPMRTPTALALLLLAAAVTGLVAFWRGAWWGAGAVLATLLGVVTVAAWAWAGEVYLAGFSAFSLPNRFLWVPVTTPLIAAALSYVGSVGYASIVEGREKRFIKGAFGLYLSPKLVDRMVDDPGALELGGEKRELSLLFSDLSGFTTMSEGMDAQDLVGLLNEYLDDMTRVVIEANGYLDKYIGDAIMAFWNAPLDVPDHPDRALRAAITMQRRMAELNHQWRDRGREPLAVRIGVHSGEVVVGNVGGSDGRNYSAIGNDVNLAARLEPANKDYGTWTMVSEATLQAASDRYRVRELDYFTVAGQSRPVKVFELFGEAGIPLPADLERALERYSEGMTAYRRRAWAEALASFEAALAECPTDGPSGVYVERCRAFVAEPPPANWDFVVQRTKK